MSLHELNPNLKGKYIAPHGTHHGATDFPMEEVIRNLDGESQETSAQDAAFAIESLLDWMFETVAAKDMRGIKSLGLRCLAIRWVLSPDKLGGLSAHGLADSWGVSRQCLHRYTAEFSRRFKVRNRSQAHDWQKN